MYFIFLKGFSIFLTTDIENLYPETSLNQKIIYLRLHESPFCIYFLTNSLVFIFIIIRYDDKMIDEIINVHNLSNTIIFLDFNFPYISIVTTI